MIKRLYFAANKTKIMWNTENTTLELLPYRDNFDILLRYKEFPVGITLTFRVYDDKELKDTYNIIKAYLEEQPPLAYLKNNDTHHQEMLPWCIIKTDCVITYETI